MVSTIRLPSPGGSLSAAAANGTSASAKTVSSQVGLLRSKRRLALEADARAMLGTVARDQVTQLARLLAAGEAPPLLEFAHALDERASDPELLLAQLASLLERVALKQVVSDYEGD